MYPKDAITVYGELDIVSSTTSVTLFSQPSDEWTILHSHYYSDLRSSNQRIEIDCGDDPILVQSSMSSSASMPINKFDSIEGNYLCDDDLFMSSSGPVTFTINYAVTYVPYNIHAPEYSWVGQVSYGDFMLVSAIGIFLLAFLAWGVLWSPFKPRYKYKS